MAYQGLTAVALTVALAACGPPAPVAQNPVTPAPASSDLVDPAPHWQHFVSSRFGVSMGLPDGKSWRIDDHTKPFLFATHEGSRSSIVLRTWSDDELQSRQRCELKAREMQIFPDAELETVADDHVAEPTSYDTRLWIAIEPRGAAGIAGHVIAVGGFVRRCLFFHFETLVPQGQEQALSARLALARMRIFGALELGHIDSVPKERPELPRP